MLPKLIILNLLLFTLAYFFVEKPALESELKNRKNSYVFSSRDLSNNIDIVAGNFILSKKKGEDWELLKSNLHPHQQKVNKFIQRLSKLKIVKELSPDFSLEKRCELKVNKTSLVIGNKLNYNEYFYLQYGTEKFIVHDTSPQTTPLTKEIFRINPYKHKRLLGFCSSSLKEIISHTIFEKLAFETLEIKYTNERSFSINFKAQETSPSPMKGVSYHHKNFKLFKETMKSIQVSRFLEKLDQKNYVKVGEFLVDKTHRYKLYDIDKNLYVFSENLKLWGALPNRHLTKMFYQDFWDTRIFKKKNISFCVKKNKSDFCINFEDGRIRVVKNKKINYQYWYDVYYSLSSTALFTKKLSRPASFSNEDFSFSYNGQRYLAKIKGKIITVFNLDSNYQLEFERRSSMEKLANIF